MMTRLIVKAKKLNKRRVIPGSLPDPEGIVGIVLENYTFEGEEVLPVPNPSLGRWYKDKDNHFYWGGALTVLDDEVDEQAPQFTAPDNTSLEDNMVKPALKKKIEQVINAFETGTAEGNYATLVKLKDHRNTATGALEVQITFGRSQTTEFSHLKELVQDYIESNGLFADELKPFLSSIGKKPSLATNEDFCATLKKAGKNDPVMKVCQDRLFDNKYYLRAYSWFIQNGFTLPLSLLVIYDSHIHSGSILPFLRKKFSTALPVNGGNEKEWIANYVNARHNWLAGHSNHLLRSTVYRTNCFKEQIQQSNWDLSQPLKAHGVLIA